MKTMDKDDLIAILKTRFEMNMPRHTGISWNYVEEKLKANPEKMKALKEMESTGGEPDVIRLEEKEHGCIFCDCSPESPAGRRSLCYDREALDTRRDNKPIGSAIEMASVMGIEILTEDQYRELHRLGDFDRKTSSWIKTPESIRQLGGALFGDRRYDHIFVYHNGAESYYAARGFRGLLEI